MTPLDILDEITEILTGLLSGYSDYSGTPYTVYKQNLPDDWDINEDYEGMEDSPEISLLPKRNYPHCLVTIEDGMQDSSQSACDITLFFAVKDESEDRCGYRDIMNVIEAVRQYFVNNRDVRLGTIQFPIEWTIEKAEEKPFYFGGLFFRVEIPNCVPHRWV